MPLAFTNTLTGKKEAFTPLRPKEARMYTCGPTVYDFAHIGNFRAYVFEDLLRRVLELRGFRVTQVMNLTDVDDKTIRGAREKGVTLNEYTAPFIQAFFEDLGALRIERAEHYPRATEYISEMIRLIEALVKSGHAYARDGSIYYRIKQFAGYGKLSKKKIDANIAGARVDQDEYQKDEPADFALWKKTEPGEPSWPSPFGEGRPGWHIECSAMSMKLLGETFDIHTGGEDNIFPHHENEIAQSEAASGKPFVHFWLHCRFLLVDGEKMSKSKGNFYTVRDVLKKGADPLALRYLLLSHDYGQPLNFTLDSLKAAEKTIRRLGDFNERLRAAVVSKAAGKEFLKATEAARKAFNEALDDDLSIARALGIFFEWMNEANASLDKKALTAESKKEGEAFLGDFEKVVDVFSSADTAVPEAIQKLAKEREDARRARDFARADRLRDELLRAGYAVEDTPAGPKVKKK